MSAKVQILKSETFPLSGNRLIEASAGTGKTYTITNLYLRLLLGQGEGSIPLAVNQILTLTFTIAATEELRARIRSRIQEAKRAFEGQPTLDEFLLHLIDNAEDRSRSTKLLSAALKLLDEAAIFTIHGFCARVLADNAFETGTLFEQDLDADRDALLTTAVEDCFRKKILTLPSELRDRALGLWSTPDQLLSRLKPFLFRPDLILTPPFREVNPEEIGADVKALKRIWIEDNVEQVIIDSGIYGSTNTIKRLPDMRAWCASEDSATDHLEPWTHAFMSSKSFKKGGSMARHPALDIIERIFSAKLQQDYNLWHLVIESVRENLERYKADFSQLTLDDLMTKVRDTLGDPTTGDWLAERLAKRWPVVMIDEFQDTDDVQLDIFSSVGNAVAHHSLFYIGDPKQAIYQFRGADVFTYINARRQIDPKKDIFSLTTNWRSTPSLVAAVNFLFDQPDIFDNDDDIPFEPVVASPDKDHLALIEPGGETAPVTLFQVSTDGNKNQVRRLAMAYAAEEVRRLLLGGENGEIQIGDQPVQAGSIAILVRDKRDARAAREALAARNIRSVYVTLESVFLTETAEDLRAILEAVLEPTNERALRAALAVPLMQSKASEIASLSSDVTVHQRVLEEFTEYHQLWARMDVATMIEQMMVKRRIPEKWFGSLDGERQITNLRHLTELLQTRSTVAPGMHRLLKWFTREKIAAETVAIEERQLRLESDQNLVQIVTMHASKGLEYDVVMIPMAGFTPLKIGGEPSLFHEMTEGRFETVLDFSREETNLLRSDAEKSAEDMRLLYVAITRARYKCYIGVPAIKPDLKKSALARLLRLTQFDPSDISAHLNNTFLSPLFEIRRFETEQIAELPYSPREDGKTLMQPSDAPRIDKRWRMHSYSGIARLTSSPDTSGKPSYTDSALKPGFIDDESQPETKERASSRISRFTFPRGPRAGVALHTLLEHVDFIAPETEPKLVSQCLDRVNLMDNRQDWTTMLNDWIKDILATPLPSGTSLGAIDRTHRLDELEFYFPLSTGPALISLLLDHGYLSDSVNIGLPQLEGMMTGLIDLVFQSGDKFWLVDYKSNYLGDSASDYESSALKSAIVHHQYDLQYLIYTVALNRYLASRIPNYDFNTHFGGVCYLFLRGVDGRDGESGVFFDRPDLQLVSEMDELIGGRK